MPIGVDFGTSNTVLAVWDPARKAAACVHLPEYGRVCDSSPSLQATGTAVTRSPADLETASLGHPASVIPTLIHYAEDRRRWLGRQVIERGLYGSERTFRWMKRFIAHRSPARIKIDGRDISHFEAGREFLSTVLTLAAAELKVQDEEVAFTTPVEAYEHFENWVAEAATKAGWPRFRLIDEPSAAALGYGAHLQPGQVYLIFDFGGGTLDVSMVQVEEEERASGNRRCRVLGKAGTDLGGSTLDQWLFLEVLRRHNMSESDEAARGMSRALLVECEAAKERLSTQARAEIRVSQKGGAEVATEFTPAEFEELLDKRAAFTRIDQTIRRALNSARERGYCEENIQAVLMVGGSSFVPPVQRLLQRMFGRERVLLDRPLDAVARGAAALVAGADFYDHIQHDYAIRYLNAQKGDYDYRVLVKRGTQYPTREPLARLTVKASYDNQAQLGLAIFEIGHHSTRSETPPFELVFDPAGAARMVELTAGEQERRTHFWVNEQCPTFLHAEPPATRGEPRFEVLFSIDGNKRLLITARDLKSDSLVYRDLPVVQLT